MNRKADQLLTKPNFLEPVVALSPSPLKCVQLQITLVHMAEGVADFLNLEQVEFKWREVKYFIVFLTEHLRIIS